MPSAPSERLKMPSVASFVQVYRLPGFTARCETDDYFVSASRNC